MTTETIVAVFNNMTTAKAAITDLENAGIPRSAIEHYSKDETTTTGTTTTGTGTGTTHGGGFFDWLFGNEPHADSDYYNRSYEQGHVVVTVISDITKSTTVTDILEGHSPLELDHHEGTDIEDAHGLHGASSTSSGFASTPGAFSGSGTTATGATSALGASTGLSGRTAAEESKIEAAETSRASATSPETMKLREEQLDVGKREIRGGVTRLRRYTTEVPVEEQIRLRNERVSVVRRPVTGSVSAGSEAFVDKTIEATSMREEPVVSKTTRVVEEVGLEKEVDERVETVRDTVRKEEVEIDEGGKTPLSSAGSGISQPGTVAGSNHPNLKHPVETVEDKIEGKPTPADRQAGNVDPLDPNRKI